MENRNKLGVCHGDYKHLIRFFCLIVLISSCDRAENKQFVDRAADADIAFSNDLSYTEDFNPYTYKSYFNGGGVALGDINNDGLLDIYLTGNLVDNKLYLNKGNWVFEDITSSAGVACPNVWSAGATFVDINADGLLDLYVCKSGKPEGENRNNELFINQGDLTFKEESKRYGLDITGLSTHAAFFDYDRDGDLDCYLLTNSIKSVGGYELITDQREQPDPLNGGNKFFVNHEGMYFDSTVHKGIYTSEIGFGLGITLSDFNEDGWTDLFISNDFFERDYLYLNNQGKSFTESLESYFGSISMGSMGADAADLNNDLLPDLFVTEMLPREIKHQRTKTVFESWDKQKLAQSKGYFNQYSRNVLQMNAPSGQFVELGRYADVSATDWSWGALMFDFDNDGAKDIFVSNGIFRDLLDRDYLTYAANDQEVSRILKEKGSVITDLLETMPTTPVSNRAFVNRGNLRFVESGDSLGLGQDSYSNGSAYGDFDNDGDFDLVVNNVGRRASLYENRLSPDLNNSLTLSLKGDEENTFAIGARVKAYSGQDHWMVENFPSRGFQSSVDYSLIIGLGTYTGIDSLRIYWPDGTQSYHGPQQAGRLEVDYEEIENRTTESLDRKGPGTLGQLSIKEKINHQENNFVDFDRDRLLPLMYHNEGPGLLVHDFDKNGKTDVLVGGAKGGAMFAGQFDPKSNTIERLAEDFNSSAISEDTELIKADFNGDGWDDLYVASGGKAFSKSSNALLDRVYINDQKGNFQWKKDAIPLHMKVSTGAVVTADFDQDGDIDVLLAERFHPFYYGQNCSWFVLLNDGAGAFIDKSEDWFGEQELTYMATDAAVIDYNLDGRSDVLVSTDWGPVVLLENTGTGFTDKTASVGLSTTGWWSALHVVDIDFDGDADVLAGNHGENSFFKDEIRLYIKDFDQNGTLDYFYCVPKDGKYYPIADRNEIVTQLPGLKKKILYFKDYAEMAIDDLFSSEELEGARILQAEALSSQVFINEGGTFSSRRLPWQLQLSPVYAFAAHKVAVDKLDIFVGGNQYLVKPQFGRFDALPLTILHLSTTEEETVEQTAYFSQIRDIEVYKFDNNTYVFTASTDDEVEVFKYN